MNLEPRPLTEEERSRIERGEPVTQVLHGQSVTIDRPLTVPSR